MAGKTLVFIHGSDPKQDNTPWMFYHLHPSSYRASVLSEGMTFDLVYFDFLKGTRNIWKGWTAKRSQKPPIDPPVIEQLTPKVKIRDQLGNPYPGEPDRPSVLAFYDWVKAQPEKSIASIH